MGKTILFKLFSSLTLTVFFAYAYYDRFYKWVDCFNELGRCYDPDGSQQVYTESGGVWLFPTILFAILSIRYAVLLYKRIRQ